MNAEGTVLENAKKWACNHADLIYMRIPCWFTDEALKDEDSSG
jgi:hypothetical protein